jgi:hypothetical protein
LKKLLVVLISLGVLTAAVGPSWGQDTTSKKKMDKKGKNKKKTETTKKG